MGWEKVFVRRKAIKPFGATVRVEKAFSFDGSRRKPAVWGCFERKWFEE